MIEIKENDVWILVNRKGVRTVEFIKGAPPYADRFDLLVTYYASEEEEDLEVKGKFTAEQCATIRSKFYN